MLNYFNWTEVSVFSHDITYFSSIIGWEDISFLYLNDLLCVIRIFFSFVFSFFWSTNALSFFSPLSNILVTSDEALFLVNAFFFDVLVFITSTGDFSNSLAFGNFIDTSFDAPEILFLYVTYIDDIFSFSSASVAVNYDSFFYNPAVGLVSDFVLFFVWSASFLFLIVFFFSGLANLGLGTPAGLNFFLTKFFLFSNQFAFENRVQLDWVLFFLFFSVVLWVPLLMTYDDTNVELIELLHSFVCLFFVFIILFLLFRYSLHYFSFLENTVSDGYSTAYLLKQFVRDVSNTFALFLRFFLLLFRLNIYDGLDDFLDSYYIFFIDFDEDSYFDELFFSLDFLFYFSDNREDIIFYKPTEFEWWGDLFTKFFILFGKFFFFWALILEEIFRVSLALYISYLIIFEVHAVNLSFNEDYFVEEKRN